MKKAYALLLVVCLTMSLAVPTSAAGSNMESSEKSAILSISDPESGEKWEWEIPAEEALLPATRSSNGDVIAQARVVVNLGEYLLQTYDYEEIEEGSALRKSDIEISTGLTYSYNSSNQSVRVYSVIGYTKPEGMYYADNRTVYWRNPGAGVGSTFYPTTNEWSVSVDSTAGFYSSYAPPYSILDCEIWVYDMHSHRDVSVTYELGL